MRIGDKAFLEKVITEKEVCQFAEITGDLNPIHLDDEVARDSIFGERIAHGMLVASLLSAVIGMQMPGKGTIYLEQDCKFLRPIKLNDTVKVVVEFEEIINRDKGIIKLNNMITNQRGEMVISGYSIVKVSKSMLD